MKNKNSFRHFGFSVISGFIALLLVGFTGCTKEPMPKQKHEISWVAVSHSSCIKPMDLRILTLAMTEAVITWKDYESAYEYRVIDTKYLNNAAASASDITIYTTKNQVHLTNLSPKTVYTFRVTSVCHDDPATPWAEISFRTSD
jgi:hypothetical protein